LKKIAFLARLFNLLSEIDWVFVIFVMRLTVELLVHYFLSENLVFEYETEKVMVLAQKVVDEGFFQ